LEVKSQRFAIARVTLQRDEPAEVRIVDMLEWLVPIARDLGMPMERAERTDGTDTMVPKDDSQASCERSGRDPSARWVPRSLRSREGILDSPESPCQTESSWRRNLVPRI